MLFMGFSGWTTTRFAQGRFSWVENSLNSGESATSWALSVDARNSLSSMKYRLDLENGNNSEQLLEVINQGICNSLEHQLDDTHAPTLVGYLNPPPAQQHPKSDDEQR
jgi:hypothetical protein